MGKPGISLAMRACRLNSVVFPLSLVLATAALAGSDEAAKAQASAPTTPAPALEDEIARSMAASRPGPEHRWLDPLAGSWNVDLRLLSGGRETRTSGTSENRWVLGGRFLQCDSTAGDGPSRVEATTIYGYDAGQKRFFSLAMSNLATSYDERSGSYDPVTQSFLLSARDRDETTGSVLVHRQVLKIEGPDRHVLTVYLDAGGRAPVKLVEAVFTRR
jgi:hypothetical protein